MAAPFSLSDQLASQVRPKVPFMGTGGSTGPFAPATPTPGQPAPVTRGSPTNVPPNTASGGVSTPTGMDTSHTASGGVSTPFTGYTSDPYASTRVSPGAPAPAPAPTNTAPVAPPKPSLLAEPGAYENWIKTHQGALDTPTRVEDLYSSGVQNNLMNSPLSRATPIAVTGYDISGIGNTGNSQGVLGSISGPSGGPSVGSSASVLSSLTTGPTSGPDARSSAGVLAGLATGPSASTDVYNTSKGTLSGPGALEQRFAEMGDAFDDPSAYEDFYSKYGADPMQKSYTETLYEQGLGQLDPYYDYAEKRALDAAQNRSAARGGFNSGLAAQQESDITANLRGQQAKTWVDLAPVADQTKRARYDQGSNFAKTASDEYRDRILSGFGIAKDTQAAQNTRFDTLSGIASRGDAADTARANTRVTAAGNADDASIGAFGAEWSARNAAGANRVTAAGNADDANVDAYSAEWNARNTSDANRVSAARSADQAAIDRARAENDAKYQSGQLSLSQYQANNSLYAQQSADARANLDTLFGTAGAADASQMNRFTTQGTLNKDLQTTGQNRVLGGLDAISGQSERDAQLAQQIYSDMSGINSLDETALQALADKYGISLQKVRDIATAGGKVISGVVDAFS